MSESAGKILIVDDEPDVRTYVALVLSQNGYEVLSAGDVPSALEHLKSGPLVLACIDIMMPKESGLSLYKQLRHNPATANIPVLIISGAVRAGEFDFSQFDPDGTVPPPDGYIEKPIVVDQFVETVNKLVAGRKGSHARP